MKITTHILLACTAMLAACADRAPVDERNLASVVVLTVEPDAKCTSLYHHAGSAELDSSICSMPSKLKLYCSVDLAAGVKCTPLNTSESTPPAPPAPPPAPVPATAPQSKGSGAGSAGH